MKLMMSNYEVTLTDENNPNDLYIVFGGPKESPYEGVRIFFTKLLKKIRVCGKCTWFFQNNTLTNLLR